MTSKKKEVTRATSWYVINIKARRTQTPKHYVEAFQSIKQKDPLVPMLRPKDRFVSLKSLTCGMNDKEGLPKWMNLSIVSYTIIDPNSFYDRRKQQDVTMEWNDDVVANKKETELIFVPSIHTLAVRRCSPISLNHVLRYLSEALNEIEREGFDIDTIKAQGVLQQILSAHTLLTLEAKISFSNPSHTEGFEEVLDEKMRQSNMSSMDIKLQGTKDNPLDKKEDSLAAAIVNLSEKNGSVKATIHQTENSKCEVINTASHPRIVQIRHETGKLCDTVCNYLRTCFGK